MNDELNGFLSDRSQEEPQVEEEQVQEASQEAEAQEPQGEPTSPSTEKHVPLAALEAERKGRQDWKEKAIRAEAELEAFRANRQSQQQPQRELHPMEAIQQQVVNERFNTSEMIARQAYKDLDEKVEVFMEQAKQNPALAAALHQQRHPWDFAYKEGARMLLQREMGDDPSAYKQRLEEEIRARVMAEMGQPQSAPAPVRQLPGNLAGARSVAARSVSGFTGPTPFDQILK